MNTWYCAVFSYNAKMQPFDLQAPEMLEGSPSIGGSADVYSFAITLWEMTTCEKPFKDIRDPFALRKAVVEQKKRPPIPDSCRYGYAKLIQKCWKQQAKHRASFEDIIGKLEGLEQAQIQEQQPYQQQQLPQQQSVRSFSPGLLT
jgi:serine/threonine protein kinase